MSVSNQTDSQLLHKYKPVVSSKELGWQGITVEHLQYPPGEAFLTSSPDHFICLHTGPTIRLEQSRTVGHRHDFMVKGDAQLATRGETGVWRHKEPSEHLHIHLTPEFVGRVALETSGSDPDRIELINQLQIHDPQIEYIGLALLAEVKGGGESGRLYSDALATALAIHLLSRYGVHQLSSVKVSQGLPANVLSHVVEYIEANLAQDITLDELAKVASISPHHFAKLFKQSTGVAPHQYLIEHRLKRARQLLLEGKLGIPQIAQSLGFYDQSHLTRQMRRRFDVTPAELQGRKNVLKLR